MRIVRIALAAALGLAVLAVWRHVHGATCLGAGLVVLVGVVIAAGLRERRLFRRHLFADGAFRGGTGLHRLMRGGLLTTLFSLVAGLFAAFVLMLELVIRPPEVLVVLLIDIPVLAGIAVAVDRLLGATVLPRARAIVVKTWASGLNALLLVMAGATRDFLTAPVLYGEGARLSTYAGPAGEGGCGPVIAILEARGRFDALLWRMMDGMEAPVPVLLAGWAVFLVIGGLGAVAYSRYMIQVLFWAGLRERGDDDSGVDAPPGR